MKLGANPFLGIEKGSDISIFGYFFHRNASIKNGNDKIFIALSIIKKKYPYKVNFLLKSNNPQQVQSIQYKKSTKQKDWYRKSMGMYYLRETFNDEK